MNFLFAWVTLGAFKVGSPASIGPTFVTTIVTLSPVLDWIVRVLAAYEASTCGTFVSIEVSNAWSIDSKVLTPPPTSTETLLTTPLTVIR